MISAITKHLLGITERSISSQVKSLADLAMVVFDQVWVNVEVDDTDYPSRPGKGKDTLALNLANNLCVHRHMAGIHPGE
jgi:hypothetical protein